MRLVLVSSLVAVKKGRQEDDEDRARVHNAWSLLFHRTPSADGSSSSALVSKFQGGNMSATVYREVGSPVESLVALAISRARQGAVLVFDAPGLTSSRAAWLERQLSTQVPGSGLHRASPSLFVMVVRHLGPAATWILVERLKRQLQKTGSDRIALASANWPVQGSTSTDLMASALAALSDERGRLEVELAKTEGWFEFDGNQGLHLSCEGEFLSG
jgi:hypothetical protein